MNQSVVPLHAADYTGKQLALIKKTIANDCNDDEFNLFIEAARSMGLDPFRRQIMPLVFSKSDANKRRMSLVTGIDGFRVIAARCQDYRPDENEAEITYDASLVGEGNPLGIVRATVTAWKQDRNGEWHPVKGVAYWDEFVPLKEDAEGGYDWEDTGEFWPDSGKPKKRKVPKGKVTHRPDGNWAKMPRVMISKCAEAQALRRGWPEQFSGVYDPAELDRARVIDMTASEVVAVENAEDRLRKIGGKDTLIVDWMDGSSLDRVPVGQFADRVMAFLKANHEEASTILAFRDRNKETMREFWARAPGDALELKKAFESVAKNVASSFIGEETADQP